MAKGTSAAVPTLGPSGAAVKDFSCPLRDDLHNPHRQSSNSFQEIENANCTCFMYIAHRIIFLELNNFYSNVFRCSVQLHCPVCNCTAVCANLHPKTNSAFLPQYHDLKASMYGQCLQWMQRCIMQRQTCEQHSHLMARQPQALFNANSPAVYYQ